MLICKRGVYSFYLCVIITTNVGMQKSKPHTCVPSSDMNINGNLLNKLKITPIVVRYNVVGGVTTNGRQRGGSSLLSFDWCSFCSVVTSVSVILDSGNGSKVYADAAGKPVSKPSTASDLASPITFLNPDRYEFYTFDDTGELVKRLMTLEEIQDIIATGDGDGFNIDFTSNGFLPEKRVNDVVHNVQNVLKEEMKIHKNPDIRPQLDTPDVSDSWSMILPAIFGNSGEDIKPEPLLTHGTPDTIMIEPTRGAVEATTPQMATSQKMSTLNLTTTSTTSTTEQPTMINVQIITNSNSTTEKIASDHEEASNSQIIKIPVVNNLELTKDNSKPLVFDKKATKRPIKVTTSKPIGTTVTRTTTATPVVLIGGHKVTTSKTTQAVSSITIPTSTDSSSTSTSTTLPSTTALSSTSEVVKDSTPAESYLIKVGLPQITVTSRSTTSTTPSSPISTEQVIFTEKSTKVPINTETPEVVTSTTSKLSSETLPTLLELLTTYQGFGVPQETSTVTEMVPLTSTYPPLSTFFIVSDNRASSTINPVLRESTEDDLSTLGTEYFTLKEKNGTLDNLRTEGTTIKLEQSTEKSEITTEYTQTDRLIQDSTKKLPITTDSLPQATTDRFIQDTTLLPTTDEGTTKSELNSTEKTEFLDQFLLSTTNIYEINSELSEKSNTLNESTTETELNVTEPVPTPSLAETIDQLLAQAIGTEEPPIETLKEATKVQEMIFDSANKTIGEILKETATIASNLIDSTEGTTETTTDSSTVKPDTTEKEINLSDSLGSILSQVSSLDVTTIVPDGTTSGSITKREETDEITTEFEKSTMTERNTEETISTTVREVPHIINFIVFKNGNKSKPAKADLSLETAYDEALLNELNKNSSFIVPQLNSTTQEDVTLETSTLESTTELTSTIEPVTQTTESVITVTFTDSTTNKIKRNSTDDNSSNFNDSTTNRNEENSTNPTELSPSNSTTNRTEPNDLTDSTWTLVSTVAPHSEPDKFIEVPTPAILEPQSHPVDLVPKPLQGFGLEDSTANLDSDIYQFVQLCNELAFGFWKSVTTGISSARSVFVSPFAATSLLAMVFLGARGATSGEMNEILKLDDMVTFNPHMIFKNVSESIEVGADSGVAVSAIVRELYSDRSKGKLLGFYKERVRQFYDGHVEEVGFREVGDVIRRRTNLLVKKHTNGKIQEFLRDASIFPKPPLAGISASIFEVCHHFVLFYFNFSFNFSFSYYLPFFFSFS